MVAQLALISSEHRDERQVHALERLYIVVAQVAAPVFGLQLSVLQSEAFQAATLSSAPLFVQVAL